jgi:fibronectin type 3 domain-containing protein
MKKAGKITRLFFFVFLGMLISCDQIMNMITPETEGAPPVPAGLRAVMVSSSIELTWDPLLGSEYSIYRMTELDGTYNLLTTTRANIYRDSTVFSGTTYYYTVAAKNKFGTSGRSSPVSITATSSSTHLEGVPFAPAWVQATADSSSSITISWDTVWDATGYKIYRSTDNGAYMYIGSSFKTSYTDTGLVPSTYYSYRVSAYNEVGESDLSDSYSAGTYPDVAVPTGVRAAASDTSSITVSWDPVSDASYYYIYRSDTPEGPYKNIDSRYYYESTSYTDYSVTPGITYYYKVSVYSRDGYEGAPSDYASAATRPAAPWIQAEVNEGNQIVVSWAAVDGATEYTVYRSSDGYYYYDSYYSKIGTTAGTSYTDTDTTTSSSTYYYYKVSASNESGEGNWSDYTWAATRWETTGITVSITLSPTVAIESQTVIVPKGTDGTFAVSESYTGYQWYLNGSIIQGADAATYTLETASMAAGVYELTIVVRSAADEQLSGACRVKITN